MTSNWQKYVAIGVMALVAILILVKVVMNMRSGNISWEDTDREVMISGCLEDVKGRAVRFPSESETYCSCTADIIMSEFSKKDYLLINAGKDEEGASKMATLLAECYNVYQEAMFNASKLD
ncbi:MAG: hypothetical protein ACPGTP_03470 [Bacteroidia bacterium]